MLDTSNAVLVQPDGWARGEREGYGEPCDVTSLSLTITDPTDAVDGAPQVAVDSKVNHKFKLETR